MWPVSQRYLQTIARSHDQLVKIEVLKDGAVLTTLEAGVLIDPITGQITQNIGGSIAVDKTTIRRSGTINFLDLSGLLLPDDAADLFAPYVTEVRAYVGVKYWDAFLPTEVPEYVPVGTLVITDIEGDYPQLSVSGFDRMWLLSRFTAPYAIAKGTGITDGLDALLSDHVPANRYQSNFPGNTEDVTTAQLYDTDSDVADAAFALADAGGWELYVDPMGVFTMRGLPSTDDQPAMTYQPGNSSIMVGRPKHSVTSNGEVYNAVVFTGESAQVNGAVPRGYAQDDDPTSLTYVGSIGVRPYFDSSPIMTTQTMVDKAAKTRLSNILGTSDTLVVPAIVNHALESSDVIRAIDPTQHIDRNVIIDSFQVPLRAVDGTQELTCRSKVIR